MLLLFKFVITVPNKSWSEDRERCTQILEKNVHICVLQDYEESQENQDLGDPLTPPHGLWIMDSLLLIKKHIFC